MRFQRFSSFLLLSAWILCKGRVELLHFKIGNNSPLCGLKLSKFHATLHCNDILVCTIARNSEEVIIPNGDFEFAANDIVSIVAKRRDAIDFSARSA